MRILVLQGANQHLLGLKDPERYGRTTASELDAMIREHAASLGVEVEIVYTNSEAAMIDRISAALGDGTAAIVCNTGSFCFGSHPIRDCFAVVAESLPIVEVHMSNQAARGVQSLTAAGATAVINGLGLDSFMVGLYAAMRLALKLSRSAAQEASLRSVSAA